MPRAKDARPQHHRNVKPRQHLGVGRRPPPRRRGPRAAAAATAAAAAAAATAAGAAGAARGTGAEGRGRALRSGNLWGWRLGNDGGEI